jgi:hypothetical protein
MSMASRFLADTTALSGPIDAACIPAPRDDPPEQINVTDLPLIAADALSPLPDGIEARIFGDDTIILWWPAQNVHVSVPLLDHAALIPEALTMLGCVAGAREAT